MVATMFADKASDSESVTIDSLRRGTRLEVQTETRTYSIQSLSNGYVLISGHPRHCPTPTVAKLCGQAESDGGTIAAGKRLKYFQPGCGVIRTSTIQRIRRLSAPTSLLQRLAEVPCRLFCGPQSNT